MRVTGRRVAEPAGTAVGRLRACGSTAVIASRIAGTGSSGPAAVGRDAMSAGNAKIPATTYFPERLPSQYLRRWRA